MERAQIEKWGGGEEIQMAPYKQAETRVDLQTKSQEEGQLLDLHSVQMQRDQGPCLRHKENR